MTEFGKGLVYCLGLFLAHAEHYKYDDYKEKERPMMFFSGASDHLYELQTDKIRPFELKKRVEAFAEKCIEWGHGIDMYKAKKEDVVWAIQEAKDLLRLIDQEILGIETKKGDYE